MKYDAPAYDAAIRLNPLDALAVNMATVHGWRFGIYSPEQGSVAEHVSNLVEKKSGLPFRAKAIQVAEIRAASSLAPGAPAVVSAISILSKTKGS